MNQQNVHEKFTDEQNKVRLYIINYTVDHEDKYNIDGNKEETCAKLNISGEEYDDTIKALLEKDGMVIDEEKDVNFIYPVSALPTNHRVTLADGRSFTAMCAIDAMGAAFTFKQDTEVNSVSAVSGELVFVKIQNGKVADYGPKELHALTFPLGELANWAGSC